MLINKKNLTRLVLVKLDITSWLCNAWGHPYMGAWDSMGGIVSVGKLDKCWPRRKSAPNVAMPIVV